MMQEDPGQVLLPKQRLEEFILS